MNPRQVVSISELQRLTGLDRQTLGKQLKNLVAVGEGPKNSRNYYLDECLTAIVHYVKAKNEDSAKARKETADAEKAEINVQRLRGDLVPVSLMRTSAADLVKSLYQRLVNLGPRILADKVTGNAERAENEIVIREYIANIFNELRSLPNSFLNVPINESDDGQSEGS